MNRCHQIVRKKNQIGLMNFELRTADEPPVRNMSALDRNTNENKKQRKNPYLINLVTDELGRIWRYVNNLTNACLFRRKTQFVLFDHFHSYVYVDLSDVVLQVATFNSIV